MNKRFKEIRKNLNLTQESFGSRLGVTRTAICNIEKGERNITDKMFKSICREFNVNEEWLRTGKGEMFNYLEDDELIKKLSAEYNLDEFIIRLIKKYLGLTEQQKNAVKIFLDKVYEEEFANPQSSKGVPDEISITEEKEEIQSKDNKMSIEEMIAQVNYWENLIEKKQAEKSSALQNQNEDSKMA